MQENAVPPTTIPLKLDPAILSYIGWDCQEALLPLPETAGGHVMETAIPFIEIP